MLEIAKESKMGKMESKFTLADDIRELTFAELDEVYGGRAEVAARLDGDAIVQGSFTLDEIPGVFATASITGTITPFGTPTVTLMARAFV
jgi:hypothetical protein